MSKKKLRDEERLERLLKRAVLVALAAPAAAAIPFACSLGPLGHETSSTSSSASSGTGSPEDAGDAGEDAMPDASDPCSSVGFTPAPADTCGSYAHLPCGLPPTISADAGPGCYLHLADCDNLCTTLFFNCHAADRSCTDAGVIIADDAGIVDIDCITCPGAVGRVPMGLVRARMTRSSPLGDHFARAAHLEAASVHAFARLYDELALLGAPRRLLGRVRRAKRDEVRHARMTAAMARRFGGRPARAAVHAIPARSLAVVALENAVEGCIRETFGALVATFQAEAAIDPSVRAMMRTIARDETRHAGVSWAIARWAESRLGKGERDAITARCRAAIAELRESVSTPRIDDVADRVGLPTEEVARALVDALADELWGSFVGSPTRITHCPSGTRRVRPRAFADLVGAGEP